MAPEGDQTQYWNYNLDHLAKYDVASFMKRIYEIKMKELTKIIRS
jgi:hypothetical protein